MEQIYVKTRNGEIVEYPYSLDQLSTDFPNRSFPKNPTPKLLSIFGIYKVKINNKQNFEKAITRLEPQALPTRNRKKWSIGWDTAILSKKQSRSVITNRRREEEYKGITVNGMNIQTDRRSQNHFISITLAAVIDSNYVCQFKASNGFFSLDAPTIIQIATAIRNHVQQCFDRESELIDIINTSTYQNGMLDEGWPV